MIEQEAVMHPTIRILLVDDNSSYLEIATDYLQLEERFEIAGTANESREALAQARLLKPDVILLDLNLGEDSGLTLIPLFKRHLPDTKIVVLTIMADEAYRSSAMQAGADAFVRKSEMVQSLFLTILGLMDQAIREAGGTELK